MYTLKLCDYELDELKKIIDKRYYELRDEMHTLEGIAEQIEDEIYCVDECEESCKQENKYECKHFQEHQQEKEENEKTCGCCCEECCECKNEEDNYDRLKEYLSTKPIFDINYNKIYNSVNILPESQQMKYKYSAVTMKLFNVIDDILYTKDLKSPIIIVSNLNNLKFTMTPYFKGFPLSKYTDKEYMSGILTNPITNQEYQVFVSSKIDKEQVIIVNGDDIEWGYIR